MIRVGAVALAAACALVPCPAAAQDVFVPYEGAVAEQGQRQLADTLAKRRLQQAQARRQATGPISPRTRAICRDRRRVAAGLPPAKARELYRLCAQAGL